MEKPPFTEPGHTETELTTPHTEHQETSKRDEALPPLEFTLEDTDAAKKEVVQSDLTQKATKVEVRKEEIRAHLTDRENARRGTFSDADIIEAEREMKELDEEAQSLAKQQERLRPNLSPYDAALDRQWKECAVKKGSVPEAATEGVEQEEQEKKPEVTAETTEQRTFTTVGGEPQARLTPEEIAAQVERNARILEKVRAGLLHAERVQEEEAEKKSSATLEFMRKVGTAYQKWPLKKKLMVSGSLILAGAISGGGFVAGAAMVGTAGQRLLGGLATFVATEGLLKARAERFGEERSENQLRLHTLGGMAAGIVVGTGLLSHLIDYYNFTHPDHPSVPEKPLPPELERPHDAPEAVIEGNTAAPAATPGEESPYWHNAKPGELPPAHPDVAAPQVSEGGDAMIPGHPQLDPESAKELVREDLKADGTTDRIAELNKKIFEAGTMGDEETVYHLEHELQSIQENVDVRYAESGIEPPTEYRDMVKGLEAHINDVVTKVNMAVNHDIDGLFGKHGGFLGFGKVVEGSGMTSPDWNDPNLGFEKRTVSEVISAHTNPIPTPDEKILGIKDPEALTKMQQYLEKLHTSSGQSAAPGEKVGEFIRRAMLANPQLSK